MAEEEEGGGIDNRILITGSCLCGGASYEVSKMEERTQAVINICHCKDCQKFHGAAFGTAFKAVEWKIKETTNGNFCCYLQPQNQCKRYFCRTCGSSLAFQSAPPNDKCIYFASATVDDNKAESDLHPSAHIFWNSKVPWLQMEDPLPKYAKDRASERLS